MLVKELIELLKKQPQEAQVATYTCVGEDSDMPTDVSLYNQKDGPYNKADDVWFIYGIPAEEKIVFIESRYKF